jgi:hypothetical protein
VAYPLFVQVGSALNNFMGTRDRAKDVTDIVDNVRGVLNNLISSWDIPAADKDDELKSTKILFAGWSWRFARFHIGAFRYESRHFNFHRERVRLPYPWQQVNRSFMFLGDYESDYMNILTSLLDRRHGPQASGTVRRIAFDYEPIEALALMLRGKESKEDFPAIGGAPQMLKVYAHGNDLPVVTRMASDAHYLLGRRLREWEKTAYPVLDLTGDEPRFIYPMSRIPLPSSLVGGHEDLNVDTDTRPS